MNPCPCGHLGDPRRDCRCPQPLVERYRSRISGALLDRIDMYVEVPALSQRDLRVCPGEPSSEVAKRVARAREIQARRFGAESPVPVNAAIRADDEMSKHCVLSEDSRRLLERAITRLELSARAVARVQKVARTIADLDGREDICPQHIGEAIQYRSISS